MRLRRQTNRLHEKATRHNFFFDQFLYSYFFDKVNNNCVSYGGKGKNRDFQNN